VDKIERRKFLKVAGAGVAGAAAVTALGPLANMVVSIANDGLLRFRAVIGLPGEPLPAYASYVLEGKVNLAAKSGTITRKLYAGAPDAMSAIAFPGLTRTVRVTSLLQSDGTIQIKGSIDDRSQLLKGETASVEIVVDRAQGKARAQFFGNRVTMALVETAL
jgi:hypothetical protein